MPDAFLPDDPFHSRLGYISCHILGTAKLTGWVSQMNLDIGHWTLTTDTVIMSFSHVSVQAPL